MVPGNFICTFLFGKIKSGILKKRRNGKRKFLEKV